MDDRRYHRTITSGRHWMRLGCRPQVVVGGVLLIQAAVHIFLLRPSAQVIPVSVPWMMNHSMTLFDEILDQHAPGVPVIAAVAQRLLPFDALESARILNLLLVLFTSVLVYALAKRLHSAWAGAAAVLCWALWEPVYNNVLFYFDSLLGALIVAGVVAWFVTASNARWWLAPLLTGLLLGAGALAKQHGWAAIVLFGMWLLVTRPRARAPWRDLAVFAASALMFSLLAVGVIAAQGNLETYIYWNWTYNFSGLMPSVAPKATLVFKLLLAGILAPAFAWMAFRTPGRRRDWLLVVVLAFAGATTLFPRAQELHAMGLLPMLTAMSGVVIAAALEQFHHQSLSAWFRQARLSERVVMGVALIVLVGWLRIGVIPYIPSELGFGSTPAYHEFDPLVERLRTEARPGDTLFILLETDSTTQIHVRSDMPPPGTWVVGWRWYLQALDIVDLLLEEWDETPPDYVVVFPQMIEGARPDIDPLVNFVHAHYETLATIERISFHGPATIYRIAEMGVGG
jgi:hypothetical protein